MSHNIICPQCGGTVSSSTGKNRTVAINNTEHIPVPDNMYMSICEKCGENYISPEIDEMIEVNYQMALSLAYQSVKGDNKDILYSEIDRLVGTWKIADIGYVFCWPREIATAAGVEFIRKSVKTSEEVKLLKEKKDNY